jgi:hypothetical protein
VWNVFVSIIEEAYMIIKIRNKTSWVLKYVNIKPDLVDMRLHRQKSLIDTKKYFQQKNNFEEPKHKQSQSMIIDNNLYVPPNRNQFVSDMKSPYSYSKKQFLKNDDSFNNLDINSPFISKRKEGNIENEFNRKFTNKFNSVN